MSLANDRVLLRPCRSTDMARQREHFKDPELPWLDSYSPERYAAIDVDKLLDFEAARERHAVCLGIDVDRQYIGLCQLMNTADPNGVFELGINIGNRDYWNRGLGRSVTRLLLAHGFDDLGANEIELTTNSRPTVSPRPNGWPLSCGRA